MSHSAVLLYKVLTATENKSQFPESSMFYVFHTFATHYNISFFAIIIFSSLLLAYCLMKVELLIYFPYNNCKLCVWPGSNGTD